jgi:hypothetical protein
MIGTMTAIPTARNDASTSPKTRRNRKKGSRNKPASSGTKFEFITSLGPPGKASENEESNRIVRIHAMQSFLRHRTSQSAARNVNQPKELPFMPKKSSEDMPAGRTGKFKLANWSRKSRKRKAVIGEVEGEEEGAANIWGNARRDVVRMDLGPVDVMTLSLSAPTRRLLHHCKSCFLTSEYALNRSLTFQVDNHDFTQNSFAVNPEGIFFDFAKKDTALMHALMSLVAIHYDLKHPGNDSMMVDSAYHQAVYHQSEAVQNINFRLGSEVAYKDDGLIGAIAILANCEVSSTALPLLLLPHQEKNG